MSVLCLLARFGDSIWSVALSLLLETVGLFQFRPKLDSSSSAQVIHGAGQYTMLDYGIVRIKDVVSSWYDMLGYGVVRIKDVLTGW